ncbi:hypothetical protein ANN_03226 [Periplaneta americana]|uniref:Uncharacterized protein n=1 Tax=Periplaneta americana TaxID=6978 RepID=A0ABQ8U3F2_PERAM|nr:hypothetical protein ANN_03226 [Periplaneta americana]
MRILRKASPKSREIAYLTLVRPLMEYGTTCWDPYRIYQINSLERIQYRAAKFVKGKREDGNDTIKELKWETLENRRRKTRITSLYRAHLGQKAWVDITARLEKPTYYGRNDHDFKIKCRKQKTDVHIYQDSDLDYAKADTDHYKNHDKDKDEDYDKAHDIVHDTQHKIQDDKNHNMHHFKDRDADYDKDHDKEYDKDQDHEKDKEKNAKSETKYSSKIKTVVSRYGEKVFSIDEYIVYCKLCDVRVTAEKTFNVEQPVRTEKHKHGIQRIENGKTLQQLMLLGESLQSYSEFCEELCTPFLCAAIPLSKLDYPKLRKFLEKHTRSMGVIWPEGVQHYNVLLFVMDAARYMVKAADSVKALCIVQMVHVTCLAHSYTELQKRFVVNSVRGDPGKTNNPGKENNAYFLEMPTGSAFCYVGEESQPDFAAGTDLSSFYLVREEVSVCLKKIDCFLKIFQDQLTDRPLEIEISKTTAGSDLTNSAVPASSAAEETVNAHSESTTSVMSLSSEIEGIFNTSITLRFSVPVTPKPLTSSARESKSVLLI